MERYFIFMDRKTQYCQDVSSSQLDVQTQCNLNQNSGKLYCECKPTDSKIYIERQMTQNSPYNIEEEQQSWKPDATNFKNYYKVTGIFFCLQRGKRRDKKTKRTEQRAQKQYHINTVKGSLRKIKRQYNEAYNIFNKKCQNNWIFTLKKMNLDINLTSFIKKNSKWITDVNVKCKTIKLLKNIIAVNLHDLGYGNDFLHRTLKA